MFLFLQLVFVLSFGFPVESNVDESPWVNITVLTDAVQVGAVCLDGSPPAYHLARGSGSGSKNWLVLLQGGAWCSSLQACASRSKTSLGSSTLMGQTSYFGGILRNSPELNPDFYNWNRVYVRYCDGASFAGNANAPVNFSSPKLEAQLTFRGSNIWKAVTKDLLDKGMDSAEKALLTGCSAGSLATILHCNSFQSLFPKETTAKCVSDAGFFIDAEDVTGNLSFRSYYRDVVILHNVSNQLPEECTSRIGAQCFFPQYVLPYVKVPLFVLNPAYDVWQIQHILAPDKLLLPCKINPPYNCSSSELEILQEFRLKFLEASKYALEQETMGVYINSCFTHCQASDDKAWNHAKSNNKTVREAVGDWYFSRSQKKIIDAPYPCNATCIT